MIQTENLTRFYGSAAAVQDPSLTVEQGELFGLLGPNGADKTTTIRMITGLLRPTVGTVRVAGHDVEQEALAAKRLIGYLAQTPLLYERLTGREFLRFLGGLYGLAGDEIEDRADHLLSLMELSEKADDLIESYSGGAKGERLLRRTPGWDGQADRMLSVSPLWGVRPGMKNDKKTGTEYPRAVPAFEVPVGARSLVYCVFMEIGAGCTVGSSRGSIVYL